MNAQPTYLFRYWQDPPSGRPGFLDMCLETQDKNATEGVKPVLLDWDSCLEWVPDRDALWAMSKPRAQGKSTDLDTRRIAIFSDLLRLRLLHRHGGVWMDADTIALPGAHVLGQAATKYDFIASTFGEFAIMNGVIAARPGSPFLDALNAEIDARIAENPDTGGWGEYGFRLFSRFAHAADPTRCLILPSGTLNQNLHEEAEDYFAPGSNPPNLSALTLCVSLHNSSTPQTARNLTTRDLRNSDTAFAKLHGIAMNPRAYSPTLQDYDALNLSEFALTMLARREQANTKIDQLKNNAATLKTKLQTSNTRVTSLKTQLKDAREAMRKTFVDLNARGLVERGEVFDQIHRLHLWHSPESVSGCGSTLRQTETLRARLRPFLDQHGITSILDIPCGDLNWLREVDLSGIDYTGADIVPALVERHRANAPDGMTFLTADIVADPLPRADCVMVRDCFSHLPLSDVLKALANIASSGAQWLLVTHFAERSSNPDIAAGDFHALNFRTAPFNFPPPIDQLVEEHPNPKNADKTLALWPIALIQDALSAHASETRP